MASVFSDPRFPVKDPFASSYGAHDYSELLNRKDDRVAVFTLELEEDLVIVGFIKVSISFRTSAKSLDLWTRIYDNGRNICQPGSDLQVGKNGEKENLLTKKKSVGFEKMTRRSKRLCSTRWSQQTRSKGGFSNLPCPHRGILTFR